MVETNGAFIADIEAREKAASGPNWLRAMRRAGRTRFEELGLPTPRQEEWRNTNVAPIVSMQFARPTATQPDLSALPAVARLELGGPRLIFAAGRFVAEASEIGDLPRGAWIGNLARAIEEIPDRLRPALERQDSGASAAFHALNAALFDDGAVIVIPEGLTLGAPIQIVYATGASEATASHPRTLIIAGKNSRFTVVESYVGTKGESYFTNAVSEAIIGENAAVEHLRIQQEGRQAYHISSGWSRQLRNSRYTTFNIDLGGKLARHDTRAVLDGEGGEANLYGLYVTRDEQHVDNHTTLDHAKPHCDSRELYKGILGGRSRSIFTGRIIVREDAQKTDAKQSNPNLLLSNEALAHTRPQLEIYANDVKCTHGATIGRMSEDSIFYLRSRGISESEARQMLVSAFAGEVLDHLPEGPLRATLQDEIDTRLEGAGH